MARMQDPRPLVGEPLPLDLVNTEWVADGRHHDLLADSEGLTRWLRATERDAPATPAALRALREARSAIRGVIERPDDAAARAAINAVLARGGERLELTADGPRRVVEVDAPAFALAWRACAELVELLTADPDRVRGCAAGDCLLVFHDTSRSGRRQWCSMATCGNRAKARRHYARSRPE